MKAIMDVNEIKKVIPHRPPFLLVDKIVAMEPGKTITGVKNITVNEWFFQGHFPGQPIFPGVLQIEAMAQTAGVLALQEESRRGKLAFFATINNAKFRKPVVPGDEFVMEIEITNNRSRIIQCKGVGKVDGEVVVEAEMMFGVMGEQKVNNG